MKTTTKRTPSVRNKSLPINTKTARIIYANDRRIINKIDMFLAKNPDINKIIIELHISKFIYQQAHSNNRLATDVLAKRLDHCLHNFKNNPNFIKYINYAQNITVTNRGTNSKIKLKLGLYKPMSDARISPAEIILSIVPKML